MNVNKARDDSPIRAHADTAKIVRFPEAVSRGRYPKPRPFGGMGKPVNETGFSDHFPIAVQVTEED